MALKDEVLKVNDKIDAKVDGFFAKLVKSKFTWLMAVGLVVVGVFFIVT